MIAFVCVRVRVRVRVCVCVCVRASCCVRSNVSLSRCNGMVCDLLLWHFLPGPAHHRFIVVDFLLGVSWPRGNKSLVHSKTQNKGQ